MNAVKIAELKNSLSRHLAAVREGHEITVLDRDTPIARLIPFVPRAAAGARRGADDYWTEERLADLERQGVIARGDADAATRWPKRPKPVKLPKGSPSLLEALLTTRRESTR